MTALLPAEITSRRVVARYLNLVADGPEDPDALPDGAVPSGDVRFTRVTDGRVWSDTTQSDGTTVRIAKGPIVAKIDPATGEIGLAHDPTHGVNLPVGLWSVEERVPGCPAKPWVLDVTPGEGVIDLHVQAPVVPSSTTVLVPSLETMERAEAAADRAETAEGLASAHAQTASEAQGEAQAAQSAAEAARDGAVSAMPHIIIGAGRPDIHSTLTPDVAARVAAATSGTVFRPTNGPQGAWEWQKRGTTWVVTQGDTGWRDIRTVLENGWTASFLRIRRVGNTVNILGRLNSSAKTGDKIMQSPPGFAFYAGSYGLLGRLGGALLTLVAGGAIESPSTASSAPIFETWITNDPWPDALPGTPL